MLTRVLGRVVRTSSVYLKRFGGPLYLIVAITVIAAVLILDGQQFLAYTSRLNLMLVLLSTVVAIGGTVCLAVPAWHWTLARLGSHFSYQDNLQIYCYSTLGVVLPGGIWPLIGRIAFYQRRGLTKSQVTVATAVEFLLTGLAGLGVYGLTLWLGSDPTVWKNPSLAFIVILIIVVFIQPPIFNRIITLLLHKSGRSQEFVPFRYRDLSLILSFEALTVMVGGTAIYILLQSFITLPFSSSLYLAVVGAWAASVAAGNLFFWVPGKQVLGSGAMLLALTQTLPLSLALVFVLLVRIWSMLAVLIAAGLIWLFLKSRLIFQPTN